MQDTATVAIPTTAITWFEIPAANLERARRFYEAILGLPLHVEAFEGRNIAIFPAQEAGVKGCLVETAHPSPHGTLVYLNADEQLDRALASVPPSGGRIELPKTALPNGMGWIAKIVDSEGNLVGLHAMS